jgi:hypothetical protein
MIVVNSEYTSVKDRKTQIQKDKEKCLKEISSLKQKVDMYNDSYQMIVRCLVTFTRFTN